MLISKSKNFFYRNCFQDNSKNSKETSTKINKLLQKKSVKNDILLSTANKYYSSASHHKQKIKNHQFKKAMC